MSTELDALRGEVAAAHGLPAGAAGFLTATSLEGLERQAAGLKALTPPSQEPVSAPDPITVALATKTERKTAALAIFTGRPPQPRDQAGRFTSSGFDGGARQPLPAPRDAMAEHGQWVAALARASRNHSGGGSF
jgi:hypothetical protein